MVLKKFKFIQKKDSNELFEKRLSRFSLEKLKGGGDDDGYLQCPSKINGGGMACNPWSSCDAWNCAPDCRCKDNMA